MRVSVHIDRLVLHDVGLSSAQLADLTGRIEAELTSYRSSEPADPVADPVAGPVARAVADRLPRPGGAP